MSNDEYWSRKYPFLFPQHTNKPKIEISEAELRYVRIRTAISICKKYPNIYKKVSSKKGYVMNEDESIAASVLQELYNLEPRVKRILDYYLK